MALLPTGTNSGCELYFEPQLEGLANGQDYTYAQDFSGKGRYLSAQYPPPVNYQSVVNYRSAVRFDGTRNPLRNNTVFTVQCGWIVARCNNSIFTDYQGLLSDSGNVGILIGGGYGATSFYNFNYDYYEFRSNDRIYPAAAAPAPMNQFKVIFFRFWKPVLLSGIQIGQDRNYSNRKIVGDVGLVGLYSRNFDESEVRSYSESLGNAFALTLADVYPFQPDVDGTTEAPSQSVSFYDPPEGGRISEVVGQSKRNLELTYSNADSAEVRAMRAFHNQHYAGAVPFIMRDYRLTPPEDIEGYFDSPYQVEGSGNNLKYKLRFKEK